MDFEALIRGFEQIDGALYDLAFYREGQITEHRFRPCGNCHNSYSVAKAFLMTGVGLLYDEGKIDVEKPVRAYMGHLMPPDIAPAWANVTLEHALTHRIGFGEGFLDIDAEDVNAYPSRDYLDMVFRHPLRFRPGEHYQYSDAAYYLISRLIACVSGEKADEYLNRRLLQPLDFREAAWSRCPQNHPMGATGLYISAGDMVKLGALYLQRGLWQGRRLLSERWIDIALARGYELTRKTPGGLMGKGGMYGQMLLFSPEKGWAAAWHSHSSGDTAKRLTAYLEQALR